MRNVRTLSMLLLSLLVSFAAQASHDSGPTPVVVEAALPFGPLAAFPDSKQYWGVHEKAGYRIEVPASWNGALVMYAHGYRGEGSGVDGVESRDTQFPARKWFRVGRFELLPQSLRRARRRPQYQRARPTLRDGDEAHAGALLHPRPSRWADTSRWQRSSSIRIARVRAGGSARSVAKSSSCSASSRAASSGAAQCRCAA